MSQFSYIWRATYIECMYHLIGNHPQKTELGIYGHVCRMSWEKHGQGKYFHCSSTKPICGLGSRPKCFLEVNQPQITKTGFDYFAVSDELLSVLWMNACTAETEGCERWAPNLYLHPNQRPGRHGRATRKRTEMFSEFKKNVDIFVRFWMIR